MTGISPAQNISGVENSTGGFLVGFDGGKTSIGRGSGDIILCAPTGDGAIGTDPAGVITTAGQCGEAIGRNIVGDSGIAPAAHRAIAVNSAGMAVST